MNELIELTVGDDPASWRAAGFEVDAADAVQIGWVRIDLIGDAEKRGIRSWAFDRLDGLDGPAESLDGLSLREASGSSRATPSHPNGCVQIDHIVVLSPDSDRTVGAFTAAGFESKRARETDQYGMPMRQTFFRAGEVIIELIAPIDASGDGPAKFFGLAHTVADIDTTATLLAGHIGDVKDAVQPGRRITTLRHKPLGMSVATAFMSPEP